MWFSPLCLVMSLDKSSRTERRIHGFLNTSDIGGKAAGEKKKRKKVKNLRNVENTYLKLNVPKTVVNLILKIATDFIYIYQSVFRYV